MIQDELRQKSKHSSLLTKNSMSNSIQLLCSALCYLVRSLFQHKSTRGAGPLLRTSQELLKFPLSAAGYHISIFLWPALAEMKISSLLPSLPQCLGNKAGHIASTLTRSSHPTRLRSLFSLRNPRQQHLQSSVSGSEPQHWNLQAGSARAISTGLILLPCKQQHFSETKWDQCWACPGSWRSQTENTELLLTAAAPEPQTKRSHWQLIGLRELILGCCLKTVLAETCAAVDSRSLWRARGLFSSYCQIVLFFCWET